MGCISREGEICGGVWRCGEGVECLREELSAQAGCISREGVGRVCGGVWRCVKVWSV